MNVLLLLLDSHILIIPLLGVTFIIYDVETQAGKEYNQCLSASQVISDVVFNPHMARNRRCRDLASAAIQRAPPDSDISTGFVHRTRSPFTNFNAPHGCWEDLTRRTSR